MGKCRNWHQIEWNRYSLIKVFCLDYILNNRQGWLTIRKLIDFETSKMVYKSQNALAPDYLGSIFQKVSEATDRQLRNSKTSLRVPLLKTSTGQKSFAYRGAKLWNALDSGVKASSSLYTFRSKFKAQL